MLEGAASKSHAFSYGAATEGDSVVMPDALDINRRSQSQFREYAARMQAALDERDALIQQLQSK